MSNTLLVITAGGGFQPSDRETGSDLPKKQKKRARERKRGREGDFNCNFPRRANAQMMLLEVSAGPPPALHNSVSSLSDAGGFLTVGWFVSLCPHWFLISKSRPTFHQPGVTDAQQVLWLLPEAKSSCTCSAVIRMGWFSSGVLCRGLDRTVRIFTSTPAPPNWAQTCLLKIWVVATAEHCSSAWEGNDPGGLNRLDFDTPSTWINC